MINRREFLLSSAALTLASSTRLQGQTPLSEQPSRAEQLLPPAILAKDAPGVTEATLPQYRWAPESSYEAFNDMKFGVRVHWGIYSIWHRGAESWPFLKMSMQDRQTYNNLYKTWNPTGFDADGWMNLFHECGAKMFSMTTKHHEGFCMFDTKTRVVQRADWSHPDGHWMEPCNLSYSIMETPFRRDVVKELCDAAHKRKIKIDLYFSHPDWYDADFRPYGTHPLQVPSSAKLMTAHDMAHVRSVYGDHPVIVPDPTPVEVTRMMARHRAQLTELLTNYGEIDMVCLDIRLGISVWPEMQQTVLKMRELQPNVMLRDRGIGDYGDYYTPERYVPSDAPTSRKPWFVIYPLGKDFSYDPEGSRYKGTKWIVSNLVDSVSKGGNFMVGVGPDGTGQFHPVAMQQLRETGAWLQVNGEGIYATRARLGKLWSEGDNVRYTQSKDQHKVYAFATQWPGQSLLLTSIKPRTGSKIYMLGNSEPLKWSYDSAKGLAISMPESSQSPQNRPCQYAWCFRIENDEI